MKKCPLFERAVVACRELPPLSQEAIATLMLYHVSVSKTKRQDDLPDNLMVIDFDIDPSNDGE